MAEQRKARLEFSTQIESPGALTTPPVHNLGASYMTPNTGVQQLSVYETQLTDSLAVFQAVKIEFRKHIENLKSFLPELLSLEIPCWPEHGIILEDIISQLRRVNLANPLVISQPKILLWGNQVLDSMKGIMQCADTLFASNIKELAKDNLFEYFNHKRHFVEMIEEYKSYTLFAQDLGYYLDLLSRRLSQTMQVLEQPFMRELGEDNFTHNSPIHDEIFSGENMYTVDTITPTGNLLSSPRRLNIGVMNSTPAPILSLGQTIPSVMPPQNSGMTNQPLFVPRITSLPQLSLQPQSTIHNLGAGYLTPNNGMTNVIYTYPDVNVTSGERYSGKNNNLSSGDVYHRQNVNIPPFSFGSGQPTSNYCGYGNDGNQFSGGRRDHNPFRGGNSGGNPFGGGDGNPNPYNPQIHMRNQKLWKAPTWNVEKLVHDASPIAYQDWHFSFISWLHEDGGFLSQSVAHAHLYRLLDTTLQSRLRHRLNPQISINENLQIVKDFIYANYPLAQRRQSWMDRTHDNATESSTFISNFLQEAEDVNIFQLTIQELVTSIVLHKVKNPLMAKYIHKNFNQLYNLLPQQLINRIKAHEVLLQNDPTITKGTDVLYGHGAPVKVIKSQRQGANMNTDRNKKSFSCFICNDTKHVSTKCPKRGKLPVCTITGCRSKHTLAAHHSLVAFLKSKGKEWRPQVAKVDVDDNVEKEQTQTNSNDVTQVSSQSSTVPLPVPAIEYKQEKVNAIHTEQNHSVDHYNNLLNNVHSMIDRYVSFKQESEITPIKRINVQLAQSEDDITQVPLTKVITQLSRKKKVTKKKRHHIGYKKSKRRQRNKNKSRRQDIMIVSEVVKTIGVVPTDSTETLQHVQIKQTSTYSLPQSNFLITTEQGNEAVVVALHDSGASQVCLNDKVAEKLQVHISPNKNLVVTDAAGRHMESLGFTELYLACCCSKHRNKTTIRRKVLIIKDLTDELILPFEDMQKLGVATFNCTPHTFQLAQETEIIKKTKASVLSSECLEDTMSEISSLDDQQNKELITIDGGDAIDWKNLDVSEELKNILKKFPDIVTNSLKGYQPTKLISPVKIELKPNYLTQRSNIVRKVPINWDCEARKLIQDLLKQKIIAVQDQYSDFISPGFFVAKKNSVVPRLVVDYRFLNSQTLRPNWPFLSAEQAKRSVPHNATYFITLDFRAAFFQVPLEEKSQELTTFTCQYGTYKFLRSPMGACGSLDAFSRIADQALRHIPQERWLRSTDDILITGTDRDDAYANLQMILQALRKYGLIISGEKITEGSRITFCGYVFEFNKKTGGLDILPDPSRVQGIAEFPTPTCRTSLRRYMGLLAQLSAWTPRLYLTTTKMQAMTSDKVVFNWSRDIDQEFITSKEAVAKFIILNQYDPSRKDVIITDASRFGYGMVHIQLSEDGKVFVIQVKSVKLPKINPCLTPMQMEARAIRWALKNSMFYLLGPKTVEIRTDCRDLVHLSKHPLEKNNSVDILKMFEETSPLNCQFVHVAAAKNKIADSLSRSPCSLILEKSLQEWDMSLAQDNETVKLFRTVTEYVDETVDVIDNYFLDDADMSKLREEILLDPDYCQIQMTIRHGEKITDLNKQHPSRLFAGIFDKLSLLDDTDSAPIMMQNTKYLVPKGLQRVYADLLHHETHGALERSVSTMKKFVFWNKMELDIQQATDRCTVCPVYQASKPFGPPRDDKLSFLSLQPFSYLGLDFFQYEGKRYLSVRDVLSTFVWFCEVKTESSKVAIEFLTDLIRLYGPTKYITTDNATAFTSGDFINFLERNNIVHSPSAPFHPSPLVEQGVRRAKFALRRASLLKVDPQDLLARHQMLQLHDSSLSAFEIFYLRPARIIGIPSAEIVLAPGVWDQAVQEREDARLKRNAKQRKQMKGSVVYKKDDKVILQCPLSRKWTIPATIVSPTNHKDSYHVVTRDGTNRAFVRHRSMISIDRAEKQAVIDTSNVLGAKDNFSLPPVIHNSIQEPGVMYKSNMPNLSPVSDNLNLTDNGLNSRQGVFLNTRSRKKSEIEREFHAVCRMCIEYFNQILFGSQLIE